MSSTNKYSSCPQSSLLSEPECSTNEIPSPSHDSIPETDKKIAKVKRAANKKVEAQISASGQLMDYLLKKSERNIPVHPIDTFLASIGYIRYIW